MNVLIIEDDIRLAWNIKDSFEKEKFANRIDIFHSFQDFLKLWSVEFYDIILLDICLWESSEETGIDILHHIRTYNTDIPVIMISSHVEYVFLEQAFQEWAHDYIVKPFRNRELQIRIQRWFRNYIFLEYFATHKTLSYDILTYNITAGIFYIRWKELTLTKSNKYLLLLFLIHRDQLLSSQFLIWKIWWYSESDKDKNLRIKILRLKKQLEKVWLDAWIQTCRGEWYILRK